MEAAGQFNGLPVVHLYTRPKELASAPFRSFGPNEDGWVALENKRQANIVGTKIILVYRHSSGI